MKTVLAYDLGGTKLLAAAVDENGQLLKTIKQATHLQAGPQALLEQMAAVGKEILREFPAITRAAVASAGPLDPIQGVLLDPTNFFSEGKSWGAVELAKPLSQHLGIQVLVDNDAAAAVIAESWLGAGTDVKNLVVMTLGTGVGIGVIANGKLLRSGRNLHPEASHIPIVFGDQAAPCGCGLYGCIEAYLGASHFIRRLQKQWGQPNLSGEQLLKSAAAREQKALLAFDQYAEWLAIAIHSMVVLFSPEKILIGGGFGQALPHFLPKTEALLKSHLQRRQAGIDLTQKILACHFGNEAGLIGAARMAFNF